jgi:hypothetical protein
MVRRGEEALTVLPSFPGSLVDTVVNLRDSWFFILFRPFEDIFPSVFAEEAA